MPKLCFKKCRNFGAFLVFAADYFSAGTHKGRKASGIKQSKFRKSERERMCLFGKVGWRGGGE